VRTKGAKIRKKECVFFGFYRCFLEFAFERHCIKRRYHFNAPCARAEKWRGGSGGFVVLVIEGADDGPPLI
jgi:hypothetical protein